MNNDQLEYDIQLRAKAGTRATLRAVVSLYLIFLGYRIIRGILEGTSPIPVWAGWLAGGFFIVAALAFGVYTWRRYRADLAAAKLTAPELPEEPDSTPDEES